MTRNKGEKGDKRYYPRPRLVEIFGGHDWKFVRYDYSGEGVPSYSGTRMKNYVVLRDRATGKTYNVGAGEATRYAGVQLPRRRRRA